MTIGSRSPGYYRKSGVPCMGIHQRYQARMWKVTRQARLLRERPARQGRNGKNGKTLEVVFG